MKKAALFLIMILLLTAVSFSIAVLNDITYNIDISYAATDVEKILTNFGIKEGNYVSDVDIRLAMQEILNIGYFTSVSYNFNEDLGALEIIFVPNPIPQKIAIEILGDKLIDKKNIESTITVKTGIPINLNDFQNSLKNIQDLYIKNGYQFVDVSSNLKINSEGLTLESTEINKKKYDNTTLVFIVKEYTLWDLELRGEISQLDKSLIKDRLGFNFKKDWNQKFFLIRPNVKETYPSFQKIQQLLSSLNQLPFFTPDTKLYFEIVDIPENKGGELILILEGNLRKIVDTEPIFLSQVVYNGNESIEKFRLDEEIQKHLKIGMRNYNLDLLYAYDAIQQLYFNEGYIFTQITPYFQDETLTFEIKEAKVGEVEITQEEDAKTQRYIVESLVKIKPGDAVNQKQLQDTYVSFVGTGFFDNVQIVPVPIQQEENIIGFRITPIEKEKLGKLMGGITWTMPDGEEWYKGFSGQLEVEWANPFGYGQTFDVYTNLTPLNNRYEFGFNYDIIKLLGSNLDLGATIKYTLTNDGILHSGFENRLLTNQFSISVSPRYQIYDFSYLTGSLGYNNYTFKDEQEKLNTLDTSIGYLYNTVDSPYRPYQGIYFRVNDLLGFQLDNMDNYYLGANIETKYFQSFYKFTWGSRLRFASVTDQNNLYPDFGAGGMNSIRTYNFYERQGDSLLLFNTELVYELSKGQVPLDAFAFFDYGNATELSNIFSDPLWSFGGGLKITVPLFGQISFGYGWDKDLDGQFWFGFGQVF